MQVNVFREKHEVLRRCSAVFELCCWRVFMGILAMKLMSVFGCGCPVLVKHMILLDLF